MKWKNRELEVRNEELVIENVQLGGELQGMSQKVEILKERLAAK